MLKLHTKAPVAGDAALVPSNEELTEKTLNVPLIICKFHVTPGSLIKLYK